MRQGAEDDGNDSEQGGTSSRSTMKSGTVTFLDVLGWKGIWLRRSSSDVVAQLKRLVGAAQDLVRGAEETTVLSISDTIVLLTDGAPASGLRLHGIVTSELICDSIDCGLPLRGATACGEFFSDVPSIMVGAAIDEAAGWHEAVDWIGVVQTPSAFLVHDGSGAWRKHSAPIKAGARFEIPCADWPEAWRKRGLSRTDLTTRFAAMGPFDPAVAAKYMHALSFFGDDRDLTIS
jgi:hypothetical protein